MAQMVKNPPAMRETWVQSLGWEDPLEEGMATHSSILAWRIPRDRGAWWTTVYGVTKSWDATEWLSTAQWNVGLEINSQQMKGLSVWRVRLGAGYEDRIKIRLSEARNIIYFILFTLSCTVSPLHTNLQVANF